MLNRIFQFVRNLATVGARDRHQVIFFICVMISMALHFAAIQYFLSAQTASETTSGVDSLFLNGAKNTKDGITIRLLAANTLSVMGSALQKDAKNGVPVVQNSGSSHGTILNTQKKTKAPELLSESFSFVETDFGIRAAGRIIVKVFIDAEGLVEKVDIVDSTTNKITEEQIKSQILKSQWAPAEINDKRVRSSIILEMEISN